MSPLEKKSAESEVALLKVLVAPTIIRYYDSWCDNDSINILMEYAACGSLYDKIQERKANGNRFEESQVLYYMA